MAEEQNPYLAVLADLERERDQIIGMIAMMRKRAGLVTDESSSLPVAGNGYAASASEFELRSDTFFGMVISDAIKKYLSIVKRPKKTAEIAGALEEGGLQHTSKNWFATVQTTLTRMHATIVKLPNGWGLLEWYPGRNFEKKVPPPKRKKRKRTAKSSATQDAGVTRTTDKSLAETRELQGRYLGTLTKFPKESRGPYQAIARTEGRERAIKVMERDLLMSKMK